MSVWINELHYDNSGTDDGEAIELAGAAGTDLTGWSLVLYNGNNGAAYNTRLLEGRIADQADGFGTVALSYPRDGIQNGSPDGIALVDAAGRVVQFLSYEGSFTAVGGPADGMTSTDIGVAETSNTSVGHSLQLTGTGDSYGDFTWVSARAGSFGAANAGQTLTATDGPDEGGGDPPEEPEAVAASISEIQGAGHRSGMEGRLVTTSGIVTAVDGNGFYIQDPTGDGDQRTSDAVFVFTRAAPPAGVQVGAAVTLTGTVQEFQPGQPSDGNLTITQIAGADITVTAQDQVLPQAVVLGSGDGARMPPTATIDDDSLTSFDPVTDGIDFYESLEGMRVTVQDAVSVSTTSTFSNNSTGEIWTVADGGAGATGFYSDASGAGITIADGDYNPECIQIQFDRDIAPGLFTDTGTLRPEFILERGAELGSVTGIVNYAFGNYEVIATEQFDPVDFSPVDEVTGLNGGADRLTVASYNVLNLDPNDSDGDSDLEDGQFNALAIDIVENLKTPDILGLQELQDGSGSANDGTTSAALTAQTLIEAIVAAGGPTYRFVEVAPADNTSGGEPGGNIRTGFLYNPDRVDYVADSAELVGQSSVESDSPFYRSRQPLSADFTFNGQTVTVVNNHFASRGGSDPLFGNTQPPANSDEAQREAQAAAVADYVDQRLAEGTDGNVVVLGDFNGFAFERSFDLLTRDGELLTNLGDTLAPEQRYSYVFEGNSQAIDHILVSGNLLDGAELDYVHLNAGRLTEAASDHDPVLASLLVEAPVVTAGGNGQDILSGRSGRDELSGGNGVDRLFGMAGGDRLDGGNGADILDGGVGADVLTGGRGADRFVFRPGDGRDIVTDFGNGPDMLDFTAFGFADAEDALALARVVENGLVFDLTATDSVTLIGRAQLAESALLV